MSPSERRWVRWHPLAYSIDERVCVEWVVKRATVSNTHRYCYFRIPKCANSTVIQTLAKHDTQLQRNSPPSPSGIALKRATGGLFRARALSLKALARKYLCFTIVRNPYARILSAYLDKIYAATPEQYSYIPPVVGRSTISDVTFEDFIYFLEHGGLYKNAHWAPQTAMLPLSIKDLSFIGHVETLEQDMKTLIEEKMRIGQFLGLQIRKDRRRHSSNNIESFYTPDLAQRIQALYASDFSSFDYSPTLDIENKKLS